MTHKINTANTACVTQLVQWLPIDANTPRGVKLQLISRQSGIAWYGIHKAGGDNYASHWAPLPTFAPGDTHGVRFEYLQK